MDASFPRATILSTEVRKFPSTIMGIDYLISTWFPTGYPKPGHKYPVIYLTDAEMILGLTSTIVDCLSAEQWMPECVIVGVGHDIQTVDQWEPAREIDLFPPENPDILDKSHKRADEFLTFIKKELIPFAEATFPIDSADRCLAGYSGGGEFALYALLHEPDLFHRYLIGSGIWGSILPQFLAYEQRFAEERKSLPVRVFISVGSLEDDQVPSYHQFVEVFKRRNYAGLRLDTMVIEGEKHASGVPFGYSYGFKALYKT